MPVILKPQVYQQWLDPENENAVELVDLLKNEIVTELAISPLVKPTASTRQNDPPRTVAVGKPQQTAFVWPELREPSLKK